MVSVRYDYRIILDADFIMWLLDQNNKTQVFSQLMHIKASSEEHRGAHNIILESEAQRCIKEGKIRPEILSGSVKIAGDPYFLKSHNSILKTAIFSVYLIQQKPNKCVIFTSPERRKDYEENPTINSVKAVIVKSGEDAVQFVKKYYGDFLSERDKSRS